MEIVLVAIISGIVSACTTALLMSERERQEYERYGDKLDILSKETQKCQKTAQNALNTVMAMSGTVAQNRNDLDGILPLVTKLKNWYYGYVSYKPNLKGGDQK